MVRIVFALLFGVSLLVGSAAAQDPPQRCRLEPVRGSCKAMIEKYAFDQGRRKCYAYFHDGCGPVVPFDEMKDCRRQCETGAALRMAEIRQVQGMPLARVEVEYPGAWADPDLAVRVNGRDAAARRIGGGSSPEINSQTLEVFLGSDPVHEVSVEVATDGQTHRVFAALHWNPGPILLLLDHGGQEEALLGPAEIRFLAFKAGTPAVRLNGAEVPVEAVAGTVAGATLWRATPKWAPGRNLIAVEAAVEGGTPLRREYSFVNLADGRMRRGQKVQVAYGEPGSRSGPFYRLEATGPAVTVNTQVTTATVDSIDDTGWPVRRQKLVREVAAAVPGTATLRIFEKPHFLEPERLAREIPLQVAP